MRRGKKERKAKREHVFKFAQIYKIDPNGLLMDWLADQIFELLQNESVANDAIKIVVEKLRRNNHGKAI